MLRIAKHYHDLKAIRKNNGLVGTLFPSRYGFSPYQACAHGCVYCDGRAERYYVQGDFARDIVVRRNLPELLTATIPKWRERGVVSIGSGVSDPYQPVEDEEEIMRSVAGILAEQPFPVSIMTKSSLLLRDVAIWEEAHREKTVTIMVSLVHADDRQRQIFEPYASSVQSRLEMLATLKAKHFNVGVLAMPLLPLLGDTDEAIARLLHPLHQIGVDFVIPGCLTLRPGRQKDLYMSTIAKHFPTLYAPIAELYKEERASGAPVYAYREQFYQRVHRRLSDLGMPSLLPHRIFQTQFPLYDEVYIILAHMQELYGRRGVNVTALQESSKRYQEWLLSERQYFNRRRTLPGDYLEERFLSLVRSSKLTPVLQNSKLADFVRSVALERATLDYSSLTLQ